MESVDLDMEEVFGDDVEEGEDIGAVGPLPDLPESTQYEDNEDADNAEVDKRLKALSKGAAKKVVQRPQPKLDADRLTGARGIPILPKLGEKLKFKGKNNEAVDLKLLMREMEHWAHRLFPSMPFDEVIQRVEKLGSKSAVKTCIKKIRLDMPLLDEDFVGSDQENDDVERNEDGNNTKTAEAMWEELIEEDEAMRDMEIDNNRQMDTHMDWGVEDDTVAQSEPRVTTPSGQVASGTPGPSYTPSQASQTPGTSGVGTSGTFTPEQLERMERNKQLALERKLKKRGIMSPGLRPSPSSQGEMFIATPLRDIQTTQPDSSQDPSSLTPNSDSQMSEVIDAGSSENIVIDQRQNAQSWCTQTGHTEIQNKQESDSCVTDRDSIEHQQTSNDTVSEKDEVCPGENPLSEALSEVLPVQNGDMDNEIQDETVTTAKVAESDVCMDTEVENKSTRDSELMSEVIPKQNCEQELSEKSDKPGFQNGLETSDNLPELSGSTEEMSEVLPVQDSGNMVLKPVSDNCVKGQTNDNDLTGVKTNSHKQDLDTNSVTEDKENCGKQAKINGIGDDTDENDFDDELTEEQLIESLDH